MRRNQLLTNLTDVLPPPVRRRLASVRAAAAGGEHPPELTVDQLVKILYPAEVTPADVAERALAACGTQQVRTNSDIRRILSQLDGQFYPSAFQIRFGSDDLAEIVLDGIRLALDRQDYSVSTHIVGHGGYEPHLTSVFRRFLRPGMTVVDVGSNVGYYAMLAGRLVGPAGQVVAIEPNSENCRLILLSAAWNGLGNVRLKPVAVDVEDGWSYFSTHVGSNGGLRPGSVEDLTDGRGLVVPTFTLDGLIEGPVDFIKLDVEGAEARAIQGGMGILKRDRPVVTTELSLDMLGRVSGVTAEEYLGWFDELGYRLYVIDRDTSELRRYQDPGELLEGWNDPLRIEDLLLVPAGRTLPADVQVG